MTDNFRSLRGAPDRGHLRNGFTAIEVLIVVVIIAILAALALPSFLSSLDRQRITGAVESVLVDLRWARSEAIKRNLPVRVTFTIGNSWSYQIHADPAGTNSLLKTVNGSNFPATAMSSASFGAQLYTTFEPARGDVSNNGALANGSVTITSDYFSAKVVVSTLGRSHICSLAATYELGAYEAC